jgi:hypothetical protein
MKHRGTIGLVSDLPNNEPLTLVREPSNQFDTNAVQVWARGTHLGYVSSKQNATLARFIDVNGKLVSVMGFDEGGGNAQQTQGLSIDARLHKGSNNWPLVEIGPPVG